MPFDNLNSRHLTEQEKDKLNDLLNEIEQVLEGKLVNLTPAERQKYGCVDEKNKLLINKVRDFTRNDADTKTPDVNWEEFERDYISRQFWESYMARFNRLMTGMKNAKILHDYDNYQDAMRDYRYAKYKESLVPGYATKVAAIKQFFRGGRPRIEKTDIELENKA